MIYYFIEHILCIQSIRSIFNLFNLSLFIPFSSMRCHLFCMNSFLSRRFIRFRFTPLYIWKSTYSRYNSNSKPILMNGVAGILHLSRARWERKGEITCTTLRVESALMSSTEPRTDLGARMHAMTPPVVAAVSQRHSTTTRDYFPICHNRTLHPIATR